MTTLIAENQEKQKNWPAAVTLEEVLAQGRKAHDLRTKSDTLASVMRDLNTQWQECDRQRSEEWKKWNEEIKALYFHWISEQTRDKDYCWECQKILERGACGLFISHWEPLDDVYLRSICVSCMKEKEKGVPHMPLSKFNAPPKRSDGRAVEFNDKGQLVPATWSSFQRALEIP